MNSKDSYAALMTIVMRMNQGPNHSEFLARLAVNKSVPLCSEYPVPVLAWDEYVKKMYSQYRLAVYAADPLASIGATHNSVMLLLRTNFAVDGVLMQTALMQRQRQNAEAQDTITKASEAYLAAVAEIEEAAEAARQVAETKAKAEKEAADAVAAAEAAAIAEKEAAAVAEKEAAEKEAIEAKEAAAKEAAEKEAAPAAIEKKEPEKTAEKEAEVAK